MEHEDDYKLVLIHHLVNVFKTLQEILHQLLFCSSSFRDVAIKQKEQLLKVFRRVLFAARS